MKFCSVRVVRHWKKFPRKTVAAPLLKVFKDRQDGAQPQPFLSFYVYRKKRKIDIMYLQHGWGSQKLYQHSLDLKTLLAGYLQNPC